MISTAEVRYGAIDGIVRSKATFYQHAAEKTMSPIGRRVFLSVMEDAIKLLENIKISRRIAVWERVVLHAS